MSHHDTTVGGKQETVRGSDIENLILERFLDKIFAFACGRTSSHVDAEDLSQEIMLELFSSIGKTNQIRHHNAWIWAIARHTYANWINRKRAIEERIILHDNDFFDQIDEDRTDEQKKRISLLHREISFLSQKHRAIIVGYYLERKKCDMIASDQNLPIGTVRRLLFEGREELKDGVRKMREYNSNSHSPATLTIRGVPSDSRPAQLAKKKIAQTILLELYGQSSTIQELANSTGVPCVFIEDELSFLVEGELIKEVAKGKYQTDMVIRTDQVRQCLLNHMSDSVTPMVERFIPIVEKIEKAFATGDIAPRPLPWDHFLWSVLQQIYSCAYHNSHYFQKLSQEAPRREGGGRWLVHGVSIQKPYTTQERIAWGWEGQHRGTINIKQKAGSIMGYSTYWNKQQRLQANQIINEQDMSLCRLIFNGEFNIQKHDEKELAALGQLIRDGVVVQKEKDYFLALPAFTKAQFQKLQETIKSSSSELVATYEDIMEKGVELVKKHVPKKSDEIKVIDFTLSGQGIGGIFGLVLNHFVSSGALAPLPADTPYTPTSWFVFND